MTRSPIDAAKLDKLAEVAIKVGLQLQEGQDLVLTGPSTALPLIRKIAEHAYKAGAGVVVPIISDEEVTLAQVFQQQEATGQPWRRFITADRALSIDPDFTGFGSDLGSLVTRLRDGGAVVDKDFPTYGRAMRRLLGIRSEQAMELFHQTISMKSVGDLNEFVRTHMLEPVDASARIEGILRHFEDLTRAHDAVTRARTPRSIPAASAIAR